LIIFKFLFLNSNFFGYQKLKNWNSFNFSYDCKHKRWSKLRIGSP